MKNKRITIGLFLVVVCVATYTYVSDPMFFFALVNTISYLILTLGFLLLPFLLKFKKKTEIEIAPKTEVKKEKEEKIEIPHFSMKRKVTKVKTTLLEKEENESTYMSIYRVDNSS